MRENTLHQTTPDLSSYFITSFFITNVCALILKIIKPEAGFLYLLTIVYVLYNVLYYIYTAH